MRVNERFAGPWFGWAVLAVLAAGCNCDPGVGTGKDSGVNHGPTAVDDAVTLLQRRTALVDVLANDVDADGDALLVTSVTQPVGGVAAVEGAGVRYAPRPAFSGADTFQYTVADGHGGTATASVSVVVTRVPEVAFVTPAGDLAVLEPGGGAQVRVTRAQAGGATGLRSPRWSPTADVLAFHDGTFVWLSYDDGGVERLDTAVTTSGPGYGGDATGIAWAPDGRWLLLGGYEPNSDSDGLFLLPAQGGADYALVGLTTFGGFSPGSGAVLYSEYNSQQSAWFTYERPVDGGALLLQFEGELLDVAPSGRLLTQLESYDAGILGYELHVRDSLTAVPALLSPFNAFSARVTGDHAAWREDEEAFAIQGEQLSASGGTIAYETRVYGLDGGYVTLESVPDVTFDRSRCLAWVGGVGRLSYQSIDGGSATLMLTDPRAEVAGADLLFGRYPEVCQSWR